MLLTNGSRIVYPSQGPCMVTATIERLIEGQPRQFYQLRVLGDGGGDLFIPVEKIEAVGIRLLLTHCEIPRLMDHLARPTTVADTFRERSHCIVKLFASGSAFDLAEIVGSLTELHTKKPLSFGEHKALEKAKALLVCEVAEVIGSSREAALLQVEAALGARTHLTHGGVAARRMAPRRNPVRYQTASS